MPSKIQTKNSPTFLITKIIFSPIWVISHSFTFSKPLVSHRKSFAASWPDLGILPVILLKNDDLEKSMFILLKVLKRSVTGCGIKFWIFSGFGTSEIFTSAKEILTVNKVDAKIGANKNKILYFIAVKFCHNFERPAINNQEDLMFLRMAAGRNERYFLFQGTIIYHSRCIYSHKP